MGLTAGSGGAQGTTGEVSTAAQLQMPMWWPDELQQQDFPWADTGGVCEIRAAEILLFSSWVAEYHKGDTN